MLWICLTAWAGLFIWYFRMRKKAEDHKLVRRIFCLAATGFIAGTALCLPIGVRKVSGDEKAELQLERGALGSQPTEEKLEVSVGNQKPERITLSVPARAYSAEEIEEAFSAAIEALDEIILGGNLSFHTVNRNMDLVTEIPGSPVALSWETDRPLLIDSRDSRRRSGGYAESGTGTSGGNNRIYTEGSGLSTGDKRAGCGS